MVAGKYGGGQVRNSSQPWEESRVGREKKEKGKVASP